MVMVMTLLSWIIIILILLLLDRSWCIDLKTLHDTSKDFKKSAIIKLRTLNDTFSMNMFLLNCKPFRYNPVNYLLFFLSQDIMQKFKQMWINVQLILVLLDYSHHRQGTIAIWKPYNYLRSLMDIIILK